MDTDGCMSETAFSSLKRMFGEYTCATRFQNMVKEMILKVSSYNLFRRMAYVYGEAKEVIVVEENYLTYVARDSSRQLFNYISCFRH
jgi:hypothetical protein